MEERLQSLLEAVRGAERVLILPHNDPDPDAIGSAVALGRLLEHLLGVESQIVYGGLIGRAENKALVRYLGRPLRRLRRNDLVGEMPIALVDTQPGAGNNALPRGNLPAIVLDHHPQREATDSVTFHDVRSDIGATSTILAEYVRVSGIPIDKMLATALYYGIKTDTLGLSRGAHPQDVETFSWLYPLIDLEALGRIEHAQVPRPYFGSLVTALQAARIYERVVITYVGQMAYPDLVAEMADLLMRLEGVQWAICMGVYEDELVLSIRTTSRRVTAERLVHEMVADDGSAGGHGAMAGGQVRLDGEDPELVALRFRHRALRSLGIDAESPGQPLV